MSIAVRAATNEDAPLCLAMSGACTTEHVWQIAQRDGEEHIAVAISDVRLPRPMVVDYPRTAQHISATPRFRESISAPVVRSATAPIVAHSGPSAVSPAHEDDDHEPVEGREGDD